MAAPDFRAAVAEAEAVVEELREDLRCLAIIK